MSPNWEYTIVINAQANQYPPMQDINSDTAPAPEEPSRRKERQRADKSKLFTGVFEAMLGHCADNEDWRPDARCAEQPSLTFYIPKGGLTAAAKFICSTCTVQDECLVTALENHEAWGVWGGLSERERRKIERLAASNYPDAAQRAKELIDSIREKTYQNAHQIYHDAGIVLFGSNKEDPAVEIPEELPLTVETFPA